MRIGLLGIKIGVVRHCTTEGKKLFVTIVMVLYNYVICYTPPEQFKIFYGIFREIKGILFISIRENYSLPSDS